MKIFGTGLLIMSIIFFVSAFSDRSTVDFVVRLLLGALNIILSLVILTGDRGSERG
jgi:uncharacterized membrane protein HdeD (DUF308 family)